ncbi:hypothetical protein D9M72_642790 [compost metagenome]
MMHVPGSNVHPVRELPPDDLAVGLGVPRFQPHVFVQRKRLYAAEVEAGLRVPSGEFVVDRQR